MAGGAGGELTEVHGQKPFAKRNGLQNPEDPKGFVRAQIEGGIIYCCEVPAMLLTAFTVDQINIVAKIAIKSWTLQVAESS